MDGIYLRTDANAIILNFVNVNRLFSMFELKLKPPGPECDSSNLC